MPEAALGARISGEHRIDLLRLNDQRMNRRHRPQGRGATTGAEHGQLPDDIARLHAPDLRSVDEYRRLTRDENKAVRLGLALTTELLAYFVVPIADHLGDIVKLALRASLEKVDLLEQSTLLGGVELSHLTTGVVDAADAIHHAADAARGASAVRPNPGGVHPQARGTSLVPWLWI